MVTYAPRLDLYDEIADSVHAGRDPLLALASIADALHLTISCPKTLELIAQGTAWAKADALGITLGEELQAVTRAVMLPRGPMEQALRDGLDVPLLLDIFPYVTAETLAARIPEVVPAALTLFDGDLNVMHRLVSPWLADEYLLYADRIIARKVYEYGTLLRGSPELTAIPTQTGPVITIRLLKTAPPRP